MSNANELELEMLELVNAERASAGLDPLTLNTALNASAEDHSQWMLESDTFSHTGQGGSSAGDRMGDAGFSFEGSWQWAENIGWQSERGDEGFSDDVAMIHDGLMNSPGHRANILDPNLEEIGIGVEIGEFTSGSMDWEAVMITQNFATTAADTSSQVDPGTAAAQVPPEPEPEPEPDSEDEEPVTEVPVAEGPGTDAPVTEDPATEDPATEDPNPEASADEEPVAEDPDADDPVTEDPVAEAPEVEDPATDDPVAEGPEPEEPVLEEPVAEAPGADDPTSNDPVAEGPDTEEPTSEDPVAEAPEADDPMTEEPLAEGPGDDVPAAPEDETPATEDDPLDECCEAIFAWLDAFDFATQSTGAGMIVFIDLGDVFSDLWGWGDPAAGAEDPVAGGDEEVADMAADMNSWWFDCA